MSNSAVTPGGSVPRDAPAIEPSLSDADVVQCLAVIEFLLAHPDALAQIPEHRRRDLLIAAGKLSRPIRHERERVTKAIRRYQRKLDQAADLQLRQSTQIRDARTESSAGTPSQLPPIEAIAEHVAAANGARRLNRAQSCYVCKRDYTELHPFYDAMCPACGDYNFSKRSQTANLDGRIALVTGARIKIGFQTTLMLLRAGARVIATTRFPHDAAARFAREADYVQWAERLSIFGLDLRFCPSVELFAAHLLKTLPTLDLLINNAAQTVHRPDGFFSHLREVEARSLSELPEQQRPLLAENHDLKADLLLERGAGQSAEVAQARPTSDLVAAGLGLALPTLFGAAHQRNGEDAIHFPRGRFDADGQQLDLRPNNSWRLKAADVSTPELIEVHLVNAIAPFVLVSRLKELMLKRPAADKHIVNVSAMEGVFARYTKTDRHPHTNMAKASLNMLTRTSANDYVRDGIHMNSVDTGWVTDEDPHPHAIRKRREYDFSPPLDAIDGAARVCDPIFSGFNTGEHPFGQFFKDYRSAEW